MNIRDIGKKSLWNKKGKKQVHERAQHTRSCGLLDLRENPN